MTPEPTQPDQHQVTDHPDATDQADAAGSPLQSTATSAGAAGPAKPWSAAATAEQRRARDREQGRKPERGSVGFRSAKDPLPGLALKLTTPSSRHHANDAVSDVDLDVAKEALKAVRERADGWRAGVATSLALGIGSMTIKGKDDGIGGFEGGEQVALLVLLGLSIVAALLSLWWFLRAAHGPSWLDSTIRQLAGTYDAERYCARAAGAARDLRKGQLAWLGSLVLYCATVVGIWVR